MSSIRAEVMPDFEHVIAFHVLLGGRCWIEVADDPASTVRLAAGDAVIIVGGESHVLGTERGKRAPPDLGLYHRPRDQALPFVFNEYGGSGEPANLVCGYLGCDTRPFNPILNALPRLLHVRAASTGGNLILDLIRIALKESERPHAGGETILAKLSELLFLQAVRQHLNELPADATGWLSGLRDHHVGAALSLMHGRPADRWTLDGLAREVGLSRSSFAERFSALMGTPPMQYLSSWRLQLAAQHLEHGGMSIAQAAAEVGYESEAAFNRAFKKLVGLPPGSWRRTRIFPATAALGNVEKKQAEPAR
jgi:AraC-like DNA-binding protein